MAKPLNITHNNHIGPNSFGPNQISGPWLIAPHSPIYITLPTQVYDLQNLKATVFSTKNAYNHLAIIYFLIGYSYSDIGIGIGIGHKADTFN